MVCAAVSANFSRAILAGSIPVGGTTQTGEPVSYADALADLKATFGNKKLLTPAEVAPFIGKSASAQAKLRERDKFPIKPKPGMGKRVVMSIYDVAHYIGDEVEQIEVTPSTSKPSKQPRISKKTTTAIDKTKPIRRPPSLGAALRGFRSRIEALSLQLAFEQALFTELEALLLNRTVKRGNKASAKRM